MGIATMATSLAIPVVKQILHEMVENAFTQENFQIYGDRLIDMGEEYVARTPNKIDDALLGPIFAGVRVAANIPDLPDE